MTSAYVPSGEEAELVSQGNPSAGAQAAPAAAAAQPQTNQQAEEDEPPPPEPFGKLGLLCLCCAYRDNIQDKLSRH